jgi:hypothetical protein
VPASLPTPVLAKIQDRISRRRFAEQVARRHDVDPGDVEHVLYNLTLPPLERLRESLRRARLRGIARK